MAAIEQIVSRRLRNGHAMHILAWVAIATMSRHATGLTNSTARESHTAESAIQALRLRNESIQSLTCRFTVFTRPTDAVVRSRSQAQGVPESSVREQLRSETESSFSENREGCYFFETTHANSVYSNKALLRYAFDKKTTYSISGSVNEGDLEPSIVELNRPIQRDYEAMTPIRRIIGDTAIPTEQLFFSQSKPLYIQLLNAAKVDEITTGSIDSVECVTVRWTSQLEGMDRRESISLDPNRNLVMLAYQLELYRKDRKEWLTSETWKTTAIDATRLEGDLKYYYPKTIDLIQYSNHDAAFNTTINVVDLRINEKQALSQFTPTIEDGTTVMDANSGKTFIYGGGPSPRLKAMVEKRIAESKKILDRVDPNRSDQMRSYAPRTLHAYVTWAAVVCSLLALLIAAWLRTHPRSSNNP